jgi:hypothetical protein
MEEGAAVPVSLPIFPEQLHIVAKVDALEAHLAAAREAPTVFAAAAVHHLII